MGRIIYCNPKITYTPRLAKEYLACVLQSWKKVLGHLSISGRSPTHTGPTPPLTPQTMLDACIKNFFPSFIFV